MAASSFYTYKPPALAALPAVPDAKLYNFENRPGAIPEAGLLRDYEALPALYSPTRKLVKAGFQEGLKGYGDYFKFAADDPNTPVDESLNVNYDENAVPGEHYRDAVRGVRNRNAGRGTLYSSYTDKDIGGEAERISAAMKKMAQQYASQMEGSVTAETKDRNDIISKLGQHYGEDSAWLADQVPPTPAAPEAPAAPAAVAKVANVGSRPDGLFTWKEWANRLIGAGEKPAAVTPARFWAYIAKHGGTPQPANTGSSASSPYMGPNPRTFVAA